MDGNTGEETGAGMRRGILIIGGDCGDYTGTRMMAGTIICMGGIGTGAGLEMKRGSLVAGKSRALLPGFRQAGKADIEWLRIYLTWLQRLRVNSRHPLNHRLPQRFTGDHLVSGKGEVLVYDFLE